MVALRHTLLARLAALLLLALSCASLITPSPARAQARGPLYLAEVEGVLTHYTVDYLRRALREAEAANATALLIRLGGQGAVLRAVRPLASELAAARVPVVVYVAPSGTQSGAAGALLLSAAGIAAMAPATSFGSSTPLAEVENLLIEQTRELALDQIADQISGWNAERGRATDWVALAVREGVVLSNEQALASQPPAIDLVARDTAELVTLLEGRVVSLADGRTLTLATIGRTPQPLAPSLLESLLMFLAHPTIAFMLLVMAATAGYAELVTPTVGVLAGIGFVLLLGSLVGMTALPVRWLSLLIILLAFGLLAADLFTPSHGALTVVGLVLLVVGALNLFDTAQAPGAGVALWAVAMVGAGLASFAAFGAVLALRAVRQPVTTGQESLVGQLAEVRSRLDPEGLVFVEGALWRAFSEAAPVEVGTLVRIVSVYELRLTVQPVQADEG
jgi:membrane-bound serine protease (ClpP class)